MVGIPEFRAFQKWKTAGEKKTVAEALAELSLASGRAALVHKLSLATRNVRDFAGCGVTLINPFA